MNYVFALEALKSEIPRLDNYDLLNVLHAAMYDNHSNYNFTEEEADYVRERARLLHNEVLDRMEKSK